MKPSDLAPRGWGRPSRPTVVAAIVAVVILTVGYVGRGDGSGPPTAAQPTAAATTSTTVTGTPTAAATFGVGQPTGTTTGTSLAGPTDTPDVAAAAAFLGVYLNPPTVEGDRQQWLDALAAVATPALVDGLAASDLRRLLTGTVTSTQRTDAEDATTVVTATLTDGTRLLVTVVIYGTRWVTASVEGVQP